MNIVFHGVDLNDREFFISALQGHELSFIDGAIVSAKEVLENADALSVFVSGAVTREVIDMCPRLKLIATRSTGFDHIDKAAAQARGIAIATVPSYGPHTVAEYAFALLLALSRKVHVSMRVLTGGAKFDADVVEGFDLFGKTIGIVGTGNIGKNAARIARGFGMNVLAYDVYPDAAFANEVHAEYVSLIDLVGQCDVVSVHVPYMPQTHHLFSTDIFASMKKGSYIINTARGPVIDTVALVAALEDGTVAGAGLDVFEDEQALFAAGDSTDPQIAAGNAKLKSMPQVIMTPHVAYDTYEARREILRVTADNIADFAAGTPQNLAK